MTAAPPKRLHVPAWMDWLSGLVSRAPWLWTALGNLETRALAVDLEEISVDAPIYVAGLARSGSTILLELLSRHRDVASHQYRDYPAIHVPYMWNWFLDRAAAREETPEERVHADGIAVTSRSPEAFEEMLWMSFFGRRLHDPSRANVLDGSEENPAFDAFYRDHIRKLLLVRERGRYLAKGNYNVTRLAYLRRLFPDARFVLPVRDPLWHVASLMKQHALFVELETGNARALRRMQRAGHFEFGLDRRAINTGDDSRTREIVEAWQAGREAEGWARYWAQVHEHVAAELEAHPALRSAVMIVRFEDLCDAPAETMARILEHCRLDPAPALVERAAERIRFPGYYTPDFSLGEVATIRRVTRGAAAYFGYGVANHSAAAG